MDKSKTPTCGLSSAQAAESIRLYGRNVIENQKRSSFFKQYLSAFGDPIIKIMLAALGINFIMMFKSADWFESVGIALAVFIATFVSTVSEYGSESAFMKLQQDAEAITSRVMRDGKLCVIPSAEIAVGDIISLQAGERIPADGIIIKGSVLTDQSSLNGESLEVRKFHIKDSTTSCTDLSAPDRLFSSCTITSGEALMQVYAVGQSTIYGSTAAHLQEKTRQSPLKERLAKLAASVSRLGYAAAAVVAFADLFNAFVIANGFDLSLISASFSDVHTVIGHLLHALTLAITVIVVAVPEGLPMMITVVLSSNMMKMLRDKVLARKLVGIETAGSMNILFTDKTGTLTRGLLETVSVITAHGHEFKSIAELKKDKNLYKLICTSAVFNSGSSYDKRKVFGGNATDRALLSYIPHADRTLKGVKRTDFCPFDSEKKYSWAQLSGSLDLILIKGAPEKILSQCEYYYDQNGQPEIFHSKSALLSLLKQKTSESYRVIALACCPRSSDKTNILKNKLTFISLICLRDQIRPEAVRAVREIQSAGIQTVMITGDNIETARAIALETGIIQKGENALIITGEQLRRLSDEQLIKELPNLRVVARSLPQDKLRLVKSAQSCGLTVGMTGDGTNDAPALKHADVGFAMGSGTEVAKQASDIIILDNNISSIQKAILYGRTIFKSIRKFITFQLTMNMCAVAISIIGPFIGIEAPVTVIQMLWINMIMDALGGLAFSGEAARPEYMHEPPKSRTEPILSRDMLTHILFMGSFTTLICTLFLKLSMVRRFFNYSANPVYLMTGFFALFIFCGIFNSFNARSTGANLLSGLSKNPRFVIIMSAVSCIQLLIIYYGGSLFRTARLSYDRLIFVLILASTVIPADILFKKFRSRTLKNTAKNQPALTSKLSL